MHLRTVVAVPAVLFLAACASSGAKSNDQPAPSSETSSDQTRTKRDRNVITDEQLRNAPQTNAYDLVQAYRPDIFRLQTMSFGNTNKSAGVRVFVDGQDYGDLTSLRSLRPSQLQEIRFLNGSQAQTRYGPDYTMGIVLVTTKR